MAGKKLPRKQKGYDPPMLVISELLCRPGGLSATPPSGWDDIDLNNETRIEGEN